jgi:hypothetical protein
VRHTAVRAPTTSRAGATLLVTALLCGAAGCGAADRDAAEPGLSPAGQSSGASADPSTSSTTTGPPSPSGGRMTQGLTSPVVLERTGGIAGRQDRLEVRPDGTAVVSTRGNRPVSRQLSEAELAAVVSAVRAADLGAQAPAGRPTAADADVFRYRLVAEGKAVATTEKQADGGVRRLLAVLTPLFSAPAPTP